MPPLIVDQPWPPDAGEDLYRPGGTPVTDPTTGRQLRAYRDQIILWAVLSPGGVAPPPGAAPFPVVLATGYNDGFLMQERQAEAWTPPAVFAQFSRTNRVLLFGSHPIPRWDAALWLYPNLPGTRDPDPAAVPVLVDLPDGAPLTRPGSPATREKPLLGLRAVRFSGLTVRIDGMFLSVSIDAP
jgi:hypothetical protein